MKAVINIPLLHSNRIVAHVRKSVELPDITVNNLDAEFKLNESLTVKHTLVADSINIDTGEVTLTSAIGTGVKLYDISLEDLVDNIEAMKESGWHVEFEQTTIDSLLATKKKPVENKVTATSLKKIKFKYFWQTQVFYLAIQVLGQSYLLDWVYSSTLLINIMRASLAGGVVIGLCLFISYKIELRKLKENMVEKSMP